MKIAFGIVLLGIFFNDLHEVRAVRVSFPCNQPILEGKCTNYVKRFGFDGKDCRMFMYGGCGANNNHFETIETCRTLCQPDYKPIKVAELRSDQDEDAESDLRSQIRIVNWPVPERSRRDYYVARDDLE